MNCRVPSKLTGDSSVRRQEKTKLACPSPSLPPEKCWAYCLRFYLSHCLAPDACLLQCTEQQYHNVVQHHDITFGFSQQMEHFLPWLCTFSCEGSPLRKKEWSVKLSASPKSRTLSENHRFSPWHIYTLFTPLA